ncbi:hypothetical protein CV729_02070 [Helicobacter pylori]|nr:hypothetical protein CV729_02070 [Helicobacter pylori]
MCIGFVLAAIRSGVQTFKCRDNHDDVNDGFLVEYGINLIEYFFYCVFFILIFFPYIVGIVLLLIVLFSND